MLNINTVIANLQKDMARRTEVIHVKRIKMKYGEYY